ncbi:hypothetical protein N7492_009173 [Penicillium capsulatum]|uniref:Uncharacterized protein n=1 Tax=Penicillium capsulatum TaxID=69766 RepID=A0A9W9LI03_9EURO|nr:hypothetical protein N7492_009173 [Penicillium capsulatum]KAJ6106571.1 hypothetical protein N7512_010088 [Penicillium capsulatum]
MEEKRVILEEAIDEEAIDEEAIDEELVEEVVIKEEVVERTAAVLQFAGVIATAMFILLAKRTAPVMNSMSAAAVFDH